VPFISSKILAHIRSVLLEHGSPTKPSACGSAADLARCLCNSTPAATTPASHRAPAWLTSRAEHSLESDVVPFGLLFSVAGPYAAVSQTMLNGAMLAVDEVNTRDDGGMRLHLLAANPAGRLERYTPAWCTDRLVGAETLCRVEAGPLS